MRYTKNRKDKVMGIVNKYRIVKDRVQALKKAGFDVRWIAVGGGGVGTIHKRPSLDQWRLQVGSGRLKAYCVVFESGK